MKHYVIALENRHWPMTYKTTSAADAYECIANLLCDRIAIVADLDYAKEKFIHAIGQMMDGQTNSFDYRASRFGTWMGRSEMFGKWKVTCNPIGGTKMYAVYRLIDESEVDHSGNREYAGGFMADRAAAQALADQLNGEEEHA